MNIIKEIRVEDGISLLEQYRESQLSYPKFFKMDTLCKLGYLACSKLLDNTPFEDGEEVALVMYCRSASIRTDCEFEKTIRDENNFFPSPSLFVYTLPNIVLGEIAIAFNIRGENCCYIVDGVEQTDFEIKVQHLFDFTPMKKVICAWIECSEKESYSKMILVEK